MCARPVVIGDFSAPKPHRECWSQKVWRRERNFANRVVVRKPLQALPSAKITAGRIHSSLRGQRRGRRKVGSETGTSASIS